MNLKKHPFAAVINESSHILILGSLPSVVSVQKGFYYMHPQNRFWKILSILYQEDAYSMEIEEKRQFILKHNLALYDVIEECQIDKSSDQSIRLAKVMDIARLIEIYPIKKIIFNGNKAYSLFIKRYPELKSMAIKLPSTSSANAGYSLEILTELWRSALFAENQD